MHFYLYILTFILTTFAIPLKVIAAEDPEIMLGASYEFREMKDLPDLPEHYEFEEKTLYEYLNLIGAFQIYNSSWLAIHTQTELGIVIKDTIEHPAMSHSRGNNRGKTTTLPSIRTGVRFVGHLGFFTLGLMPTLEVSHLLSNTMGVKKNIGGGLALSLGFQIADLIELGIQAKPVWTSYSYNTIAAYIYFII